MPTESRCTRIKKLDTDTDRKRIVKSRLYLHSCVLFFYKKLEPRQEVFLLLDTCIEHIIRVKKEEKRTLNVQ